MSFFYHASTYPHELQEIHIFSHFGTVTAAAERISGIALHTEVIKSWVYEVKIPRASLKTIKDPGISGGFGLMLAYRDTFSFGTRDWKYWESRLEHYREQGHCGKTRELRQQNRKSAHGNADSLDTLITLDLPLYKELSDAILRTGLCGFKYRNCVEDSGKISICPAQPIKPNKARQIECSSDADENLKILQAAFE